MAEASGAVPDGPSPGERWVRRIGLVAGPVLAVVVFAATSGLADAQRVVAVSATLMAAFWMCESIPMWATACIPFVVFPIFGVGPWTTAPAMAWNPLILLFAGGMLLARAMENTGLHRRIALHVIRLVGVTPGRLVLGLMCAGALLSMFVSNTATALMLFPIGHALIRRVAPTPAVERTLGAAAMLGLAYGCNAGGAACLIGTPPNLIFAGGYQKAFAGAPSIGFLQWWAVGLPFLALFIPVAWWYLTRVAFRLPAAIGPDGPSPVDDLAALGPPSRGERLVFSVFVVTAGLWITRGWWQQWTGPHWHLKGTLADAVVGLAGAGACGVGALVGRVRPVVLGPRDAARLPWGILVLLAGGILLSKGFEDSKLTEVIGTLVEGAAGISALWLVLGTALAGVALSALTSNTGTAGVMSPVLIAAAPALGLDPRLLLFPAALGVSCDFALPVGTPPNAIVFGSGYVSLGRMARTGIVMDLISVLLVTVAVLGAGAPLLGIHWSGLPAWAGG